MISIKKSIFVLLSLLTVSSCFSIDNKQGCDNCDINDNVKEGFYIKEKRMIQANNKIAELATQLSENIKNPDNINKRLILTSIVNLNDFKGTDPFSKLIGEKLINELQLRGFRMFEFRNNGNIRINSNGEYYLTRTVKEKIKKFDVDLILVGTYIKVKKGLSINLRILDSNTNEILTTASTIIKNSSIEYRRPPRQIKIIQTN